MNGSAHLSPPYLDDPLRRLLWITPLSILLWATLLLGFAVLLEQTTAPRSEPKAVEAQIVELPPSGSSNGETPVAASHPATRPAIPTPHVEARPKPVVHHRARIVHHTIIHGETAKREPPAMPPSPNGAAKTEAKAIVPPSAIHAPKAGATGGGAAGNPGGRPLPGPGLGGASTGALAVYAPIPQVPDELRENTLQTVALAHFVVTSDGVAQVSLVRPASSPQLNAILLQTLRKWRFYPARKNGVPVDSQFNVRIPIRIE
ncbi:MAG: energy transducer TonB [Candidatus Binataceae bacterium]